MSYPGSDYNKIIYTIVQNNTIAYSKLSPSANGCNWLVEFESGTNIAVSVPPSYSGSDVCSYNFTVKNIANGNDALQIAVFDLLELLDFDSDGLLDVEFAAQDLQISSSEIVGIPFAWSTEMQIRTWY